MRTAEEFFRAVPLLVPDATHMFLEGSPVLDIEVLLVDAADEANYAAPIGHILVMASEEQAVFYSSVIGSLRAFVGGGFSACRTRDLRSHPLLSRPGRFGAMV